MILRISVAILLLLQILLPDELLGKDTYLRGFYHGRNVFIRNPFMEEAKTFCIQKIYVNGNLVVSEPEVSAVEIDLTALNLDDRVVLRIIHFEGCTPELINPEVIQNNISFSWMKLYVNEESILWITSKESKKGYYVIEQLAEGAWEAVDTVKTTGNIFINQHGAPLDHIPGNNSYRVVYYPPNEATSISPVFEFFSDKREISHAIDTDKWTIEFTEEVNFQLLNSNSFVLKRGKAVSYDIKKLPKGTYILKYEGNEYTFEKTGR